MGMQPYHNAYPQPRYVRFISPQEYQYLLQAQQQQYQQFMQAQQETLQRQQQETLQRQLWEANLRYKHAQDALLIQKQLYEAKQLFHVIKSNNLVNQEFQYPMKNIENTNKPSKVVKS
jgi:hypothetical protein